MIGLAKRVLLGLLVIFLVAAAGCGATSPALEEARDEKAVVVATIFPLADITRNIGGDRVEVVTLLPGGASPHTFEPTPRQMRQVSGAKVIIRIGAGLDDWAEKLSGVAGVSGDTGGDVVRLGVTDGMVLRKAGHGCPCCSGAAGTGYAHGNGPGDPHVWLDPVLVRDEIAPRIYEALCVAVPGDAAYFEANLKAFQAELTRLHAEITELAEGFESRHFIAYHSAWNYFADRYGLVEVAAVKEAPGKEPSPGWIATVVETARAHDVGAIFAEPQFSTKAAEVIADEYGARVLILDPLGGENIPGRDSYLELMRFNAAVLDEGLRK